MSEEPEWLDEWLRALRRGKVELPIATQERSRAEQIRRLQRIVFGLALGLVITFAAILAGTGAALPREVVLSVVLGAPLAFVVVMYPLLFFVLLRGVRDDGDHPRKFYADERGMSLERANGARIGAPWNKWRYEGYIYSTVKHHRIVKALDLSLDGEKIRIELVRMARSRQLARDPAWVDVLSGYCVCFLLSSW